MRACFLGQHVCKLGFGIAVLQLPPIEQPKPNIVVRRKGVVVQYRPRRPRRPPMPNKKIAGNGQPPLKNAS